MYLRGAIYGISWPRVGLYQWTHVRTYVGWTAIALNWGLYTIVCVASGIHNLSEMKTVQGRHLMNFLWGMWAIQVAKKKLIVGRFDREGLHQLQKNSFCSWWRPSRSKLPTIIFLLSTWIAHIPQRKFVAVAWASTTSYPMHEDWASAASCGSFKLVL